MFLQITSTSGVDNPASHSPLLHTGMLPHTGGKDMPFATMVCSLKV